MKNQTLVLLLCCLVLLPSLAGCAGQGEPAEAGSAVAVDGAESEATYESVDYDLSDFSETMTYAQIYNMAASPSAYEGKTVCLKGAISRRTEDGQEIYSCTTYDEEGCCTQKIDLELREGETPVAGRQMHIAGVFAPGIAASEAACRLLDAVVW